mmetsp:Transcript_25416/g.68804  ORF Transcript_25416/g.68804 Transcript_25416/m.68804 type:complete len:206 (+) Transcript_25416:169-786(+)
MECIVINAATFRRVSQGHAGPRSRHDQGQDHGRQGSSPGSTPVVEGMWCEHRTCTLAHCNRRGLILLYECVGLALSLFFLAPGVHDIIDPHGDLLGEPFVGQVALGPFPSCFGSKLCPLLVTRGQQFSLVCSVFSTVEVGTIQLRAGKDQESLGHGDWPLLLFRNVVRGAHGPMCICDRLQAIAPLRCGLGQVQVYGALQHRIAN